MLDLNILVTWVAMIYCQMPLIAYVSKGVQKHCQRYKNLLGHTQRTSEWRLGSYDEPIELGSYDAPKIGFKLDLLSQTQLDSIVE